MALTPSLVGTEPVHAAPTGSIAGMVYDVDAPSEPIRADVFLIPNGDTEAEYRLAESTEAAGFHFEGVEPGQYAVCFGVGGTLDVVQRCYGGATRPAAAALVTVSGSAIFGIDGQIRRTGSLSGTIFGQFRPDDAVAPLTNARVGVTIGGPTLGYLTVRQATTDPGTNTWRVDGLPIGTYYVRFSHPSYHEDWWDESPVAPWGPGPVQVYEGNVTPLNDVLLKGRYVSEMTVQRVTGADRFETSVEISHEIFPVAPSSGVPVVYIANGLNFPDALAAGPAAIVNGGAVLLVYPWAIPDVVHEELLRLRPQRIVVTGGAPSVGDDVYQQLRDYVAEPDLNLVRLTGTDRFGTSREIARDTFHDVDSPVAFIATGMNYPDALAAGPAAGLVGAPIILVNGAASRLDDMTTLLLDDLGVEEVFIIGGPPSVSPGIENHLRETLGSSVVTRLTGADRFGTSVAIAQYFFEEAHNVHLATGMNFPDALAGGPLAARWGSPMYLSRQQCISRDVADDFISIGGQVVVVLGGTPSLSDTVTYFIC